MHGEWLATLHCQDGTEHDKGKDGWIKWFLDAADPLTPTLALILLIFLSHTLPHILYVLSFVCPVTPAAW